MSDLAWARVERGLWARLDAPAVAEPAGEPRARSRRWVWIAVPSAAVAIAAAAVFLLVVDTPQLPAPAPVVAAPPVELPTRIVSGAAPSTITRGDVHVTLDADSAVVMPAERGSTAVLERGAATFAIAPRAGRQFLVVAGDAIVRVASTQFRVARFAEHVTVEVERGDVDITFRGATVKLGSGGRWSSQPAATLDVAASPVAEIERPKPKRTAPKLVAATDDERARYERFAGLEAKQPDAALLGYLEIARGNGPWAAISLYAAARLAADRGEARAKILLDAYLRRFPRGANADDARQLLDSLKGAP
jgi:hypothetical protein